MPPRTITRAAFLVLGGLAMIALPAPRARAGLVLASTTYNPSGFVDASFSTDAGGSYQGTSAGAFSSQFWSDPATPSGPSFLSFCVDLEHSITSTPPPLLAIVSAEGGMFGGRNLGAAGWIVNRYAPTPNEIDTAGTTGSVGLADRYAAVQVAIWKATYDSGSTDLSGGQYRFQSSANVLALARNILVARGSQTSTAGFINYAPNGVSGAGAQTNQDMIFAVPEPSTFAMGALGLASCLGYRWRHSRRPKPIG